MTAWPEEREAMLRIPQSEPDSGHVVCKQLSRAKGQLPRWTSRGPNQSELRRQLWKVEAGIMEVQISPDKVWDASAGRLRVGKGGVGPVEASYVLVEGEERWVLDELPAELSEQAYM